jgi:hypothetical protein
MPATKLNTPWTPRDLKRTRSLAAQGYSAREAAAELGRSTGAVKYKAMVEGIRFKAINQPVGPQKRLARLRMKTGRMDVTLRKAA